MTAHDLIVALVAAALVIVGVLVGSVADRIRGNRAPAKRHGARSERDMARGAGINGPIVSSPMARDVITALRTAGYDKGTAELAVIGCPPSQCSTIESWTRAALSRVARKEGNPS